MRACPVTPGVGAPAGVPRSEDAPPPPGAAGLSWRALAWSWALCIAVVVASAAVTALVAPAWLSDDVRELPNDPLLMADIFVNNLLLVVLPLLGGWLAAGHLAAGRRRWAWLFMAPAAAIAVRSLLTIGAVGGADPTWLLGAARWWLLELAALGTASASGLWLVRHPAQRDDQGPAIVRRALVVAVGTLAGGAVIEVLSA